MSAKYDNYIYLTSAAIATNTTGDKATFIIPTKCKLVRSQVITQGTEASALTIKFDYAPTVGSTSGRGDGDMGVITWATGDKSGKAGYDRIATAAGDTTLNVGGAIVARVSSASTADKATYVGVVLAYMPETEANQSNFGAEGAV